MGSIRILALVEIALPVLAVTAYALQRDKDRILESGFNGYPSKPIDAKSLAQELERLLRKCPERSADSKQSGTASNPKMNAAGATGSDVS